MGRTEGGVGSPGVPDAEDPAASSSPPAERPEPLGVLWTWTPDVEPADVETADVRHADVEPVETPSEPSLAERVAEVVREVEVASGVVTSTDPSVGVLWSWTPPDAVDPPPPPPPPAPPIEPAARAVEPPPAPAVEAPPTPVAAPLVPAAALLLAPVPQGAPTRSATATLAPPIHLQRHDDERTRVRPAMALDPTLVLPPPAPLPPPIYGDTFEADVWTRVPPVRLPSRGSVRVALGALAIAVCAALPWVVPQIPDLFAGAVPDQVSTPITTDPPIGPPPTAPPTPNESLTGKRLASAGTPLEVTVQRLHVHSDVVPISGNDGELIPPNDPQILGWWKEGRVVGASFGSAVITGHTVSKGGGAFDHLGELVPGDQISVRTAAGTIEYVVRESHDVSVSELARTSASIFKQVGPGRLVLITCSDFNGTVYLSNSIVYASPIADKPARRK